MSTGDEIQGIATTEEAQYKPLWGIEFIARFTHWLDEFTMANSAIIMMMAILAIATDAMLGGALFNANNMALAIVGIITALGIETQARTMLRRGKIAWDANKTGTAIWWWIVTAPIIAMLFQTVWMWFLERTQGVSEARSLAEIGVSYWFFTLERAGIFVFLFTMSGVNYYIRQKTLKRSHKAIKQDMLDEIDLAPVKERLMAARQRQDALALRRVRGVGAALIRGDYGDVDVDKEVAPGGSIHGNNANSAIDDYVPVPASYIPPAEPIQLAPYRPTIASYNGNGNDDTLPPGGGNGGGRKRGRPRQTVSQLLADSSAPGRAGNSGVLNSGATKAQREQAVELLKAWLLGMSQKIARGEVIEEPTGVDAHEYLQDNDLAPKAVATSRGWLAKAIQELREQGHVISWYQPAATTVG